MALGLEIVCLFVILFFLWRWLRLWAYWKVRGVATYGYPPPIGCLLPVWTGRLSIPEVTQEVFKQNPKSKMIGTWILMKPILFIKDPQLVHQIMTDDFSSWPDRGFRDDPHLDPLSMHIINAGGNKWKTVRSWLASSFGMVAVRSRHDLLVQESEQFVRSITSTPKIDIVKKSRENILAVLSHISLGSNEAPPTVEELIREAFSSTFWTTLRSVFRLSCPSVLSHINCKRFQTKQESSFLDIVDERFRTTHNSNNNRDMLQILIDAYKQYDISNGGKGDVTYQVVASNAFVVFAAGYDTTASTLSWLFLEIARNPEVQDKLHQEINRVLEHHGQLSFASIKEMRYLDNVISEVLRLYPSVTMTTRVSVAPTTVDGVMIPAGTRVMIPIFAIQRLPENFSDPNKFNPDRFSSDNVNKVTLLTYGKGPRICLGWRLADLMLKHAVIAVLKDHRVSLDAETKKPSFALNSLFLVSRHPIFLQVHPRSKN